MHSGTKLLPTFWNLYKITDFFMPSKSYFEEKNSDLIVFFNLHKNSNNSVISHNINKRFFYFSLRIETRIHQSLAIFFNSKKIKNHSNLSTAPFSPYMNKYKSPLFHPPQVPAQWDVSFAVWRCCASQHFTFFKFGQNE